MISENLDYMRRIEKAQGSKVEMTSLKRVSEESVRDDGMLLMVKEYQRQPAYEQKWNLRELRGFGNGYLIGGIEKV